VHHDTYRTAQGVNDLRRMMSVIQVVLQEPELGTGQPLHEIRSPAIARD
jgi:hypothetical protein